MQYKSIVVHRGDDSDGILAEASGQGWEVYAVTIGDRGQFPRQGCATVTFWLRRPAPQA